MNKIFLLSIFLLSASIPSYAQFIGIKLGIPINNQDAIITGGGSIPNNALTFNGAYVTFNGAYVTFTHS